jgi:DNA-binding transcriptional ArsR family regulator
MTGSDVPLRLLPPLAAVFGYPTRIRILGVLIEGDTPMIQKELLRYADISRAAFHDHCEELVDLGLITREKQGRTVEYKLADTDGVELLVELNEFLDWRLHDYDDLEAKLSDMYY